MELVAHALCTVPNAHVIRNVDQCWWRIGAHVHVQGMCIGLACWPRNCLWRHGHATDNDTNHTHTHTRALPNVHLCCSVALVSYSTTATVNFDYSHSYNALELATLTSNAPFLVCHQGMFYFLQMHALLLLSDFATSSTATGRPCDGVAHAAPMAPLACACVCACARVCVRVPMRQQSGTSTSVARKCLAAALRYARSTSLTMCMFGGAIDPSPGSGKPARARDDQHGCCAGETGHWLEWQGWRAWISWHNPTRYNRDGWKSDR